MSELHPKLLEPVKVLGLQLDKLSGITITILCRVLQPNPHIPNDPLSLYIHMVEGSTDFQFLDKNGNNILEDEQYLVSEYGFHYFWFVGRPGRHL